MNKNHATKVPNQIILKCVFKALKLAPNSNLNKYQPFPVTHFILDIFTININFFFSRSDGCNVRKFTVSE
jgi:hypothetical protein